LKPTKADLRDWLELIAPITGARIETVTEDITVAAGADRPHHGGAD